MKGAAVSGVAIAGAGALAGCAGGEGAAAAAGAAAEGEPSFLTAPEPISEGDVAETIDTDVLIIGAGIAGSATAASCIEQGLKVVMVEKNQMPRSIGVDYGVVNPSIIEEKGLDPVDPYELTRDHMEKSCHMCRGDKVYRFMTRSGEAADWWFDKAKGYGFVPSVIAMKSESDHFINYIRPVELWESEDVLNSEGDWYGNQAAMLGHVQEEVIAAGSEYRNNTLAVQLLKSDDGAVTGAICQNDDGYIQVNASKGVVLAGGDYAGNAEMLKYYSSWDFDALDPETFYNYSSGQGEGIQLGLWAGAKMQDRPNPIMIFMAYAYSYLRVNNLGQRYVNEDAGYVGGGNAQLLQPKGQSWAIWDDKWAEELPAQLPYAGGMSWDQDGRRIEDPWTPEREEEVAFSWEREEGLLVQADTLDELADLMGFEGEAKDTFLTTVERYNTLVDTGDEDFGKRPELMCKIEKAPFYALKMMVEVGVSVGGLETNADSECLDADGKVIPGLFSVGNNAGGMFGVDYNEVTVPGISLGRSITFGYLLGQHLAEA